MKKIRAQLSYANTMATIAVFFALGGASYAATQLPKNSVGTKQLKNKAVTGAKIGAKAITSDKIADGAVGGAQVNTATLGTVPTAVSAATSVSATSATTAVSATNAVNATNATNAVNATNASALDGQPASAYAKATPLALTAATLTNGWTNESGFGLASYAKDQFGVVRLSGTVSHDPNTSEALFTLPAGYRPAHITLLVVPINAKDKVGLLRIDPNGVVTPGDRANFISLNGISFLAGG